MSDLIFPRTRPPVTSVHGREGVVVGASGDYSADEITFTPAGTISATDVQAAVEELAGDLATAVTGLLDLKGDTDCSSNPNYPAGSKGDAYYVTVAGKIGGASGKSVEVGDVYVAKGDNAGGTEASVGTSWFVLEHNLAGAAVTSGTLAQFAATTSDELRGVLSDETGTGSAVFGTSPTIVTPTISGAIVFADDIRQTFNPGTTHAGINVGSLAGDPSSASDGDLWYDSTANELTARINGANVALGAGGAGLADGDTLSTGLTFPVAGLHILDTNASHDLILSPGSDLTADRTLTLTTGDANRTLTLNGNPTLDNWFDQSVKVAASPQFVGLTLTGAITFPDNIRQTFNPGATAGGLNVGSIAGDPGTPMNGDLWYDSTANELTARINGANVALGAGGGSDDQTAAEVSVAASPTNYTAVIPNVEAHLAGIDTALGEMSSYSLAVLTDVDLTAPAADDVLTFNGSVWVNAPDTGESPPIIYSWSNSDAAEHTLLKSSLTQSDVGSGQTSIYGETLSTHTTGTVNTLIGVRGAATNAAAGTANNIYGGFFSAYLADGAATAVHGIIVGATTSATTSTLTGVSAQTSVGLGSAVTNAYGLYVIAGQRDGSVTNDWGVYVATAALDNYFAGQTGIGGTPHDSAILTLTSDRLGLLLPRMTTAERDVIDSPTDGLLIYNTTTDVLNVYQNGAWAGFGTIAVQAASAVAITGGTITGLNNTGLSVLDTDASHSLTLKPGSNLSAARTLTITTGDADRTLTLSGNATISGTNTGDQTIQHTIGLTIDGGGSAPATGVKGYVVCPFAGTIIGVRMLSADGTAGSAVIDVWKTAFGETMPTVANTITASAKPTLSSEKSSEDNTLTGWTTSVTANDLFGFNLDSVSTCTKITLLILIGGVA